MAEETTTASGGADAPVSGRDQTTAAGENSQSLQEQPANEAKEQSSSSWLLDNWFLYVVLIFWMWWLSGNKKRKAQKAQEKKERERRNSLRKGDELVTIGRIHGKVVAFTEDTFTLKPDPRNDLCLVFDRQAVYRVMPRPDEEATETEAGAR